MELVTGRLPTDPEFGDEGFVKWVSTTLNQKGIDHVIDPKLESKYKEVISKILDIGLLCTGLLPISRPAMRKVVRLQQGVRADNRVYRDGPGSPYYQGEASDQAGTFSPDYQGEASDEAVLISRTRHTF